MYSIRLLCAVTCHDLGLRGFNCYVVTALRVSLYPVDISYI